MWGVCMYCQHVVHAEHKVLELLLTWYLGAACKLA